jgi:hypothetical protein
MFSGKIKGDITQVLQATEQPGKPVSEELMA